MSQIDGSNIQKIWIQEVPAGTVNGSNTVFTLSQTPIEADAVLVLVNGIVRKKTTEWSISGATVTFVTAPALAQIVEVQYVQAKGGA